MTVAMKPSCRLGGTCELTGRDELVAAAYPDLEPAIGVTQCVRCSVVYETTGWQPRKCAHCDREYGVSMHDPCLGTLDDVHEACCGHGIPENAYVSFADGRRYRGSEAGQWLAS